MSRRKEVVLQAFRARDDVIEGPEAVAAFWAANYTYVHTATMGAGWVSNEEPDKTNPGLLIERPPDPAVTTFMVPHGEGEPAAYCWRCPALLTLATMEVQDFRVGGPRPVCHECREEQRR